LDKASGVGSILALIFERKLLYIFQEFQSVGAVAQYTHHNMEQMVADVELLTGLSMRTNVANLCY
jgi:hypothetical protein